MQDLSEETNDATGFIRETRRCGTSQAIWIYVHKTSIARGIYYARYVWHKCDCDRKTKNTGRTQAKVVAIRLVVDRALLGLEMRRLIHVILRIPRIFRVISVLIRIEVLLRLSIRIVPHHRRVRDMK